MDSRTQTKSRAKSSNRPRPIGRLGEKPDTRKLITVDEFITRYFSPASRPTTHSVWRWIRDEQLKARRVGHRYYIDPDDALEFIQMQ
jgi:hypothetical protein